MCARAMIAKELTALKENALMTMSKVRGVSISTRMKRGFVLFAVNVGRRIVKGPKRVMLTIDKDVLII
jgi:hypothetical protein